VYLISRTDSSPFEIIEKIPLDAVAPPKMVKPVEMEKEYLGTWMGVDFPEEENVLSFFFTLRSLN
jgi:hypothetical protein